MSIIFSQPTYILKRQGLALAGKYQLFGEQDDTPLLYIEEKSKWLAGQKTIHAYADADKAREIIRLQTSESEDAEMDIIDAQSETLIGRIGLSVDDLAEIIKDAWEIIGADGKRIAKIFEKNIGQSVLREMMGNDLPQKIDITVGKTLAGELRQKVKMFSYELGIDFSMDSARLLDRRLGLAAALYVAYHQGSGMD